MNARSSGGQRRVSLVGFGAIGRGVAEALVAGRVGPVALSAVVVRNVTRYAEDALAKRLIADPTVTFTDDAVRFLATPTDLVVEAAGQRAVRAYGEKVLHKGVDLLVVSIGAFTDDGLYAQLCDAAEQGSGRLMLAAGALPAVDWMQAASQATVTSVQITQVKPVRSWQGTPAQDLVGLGGVTVPTCFFAGTAREAAHMFPRSSNITAMLALATVGMDATRVRLVADPAASQMHTSIEFSGAAGEVGVEWRGTPSATNPSTSADVPLSVIKAIKNWAGHVIVGV